MNSWFCRVWRSFSSGQQRRDRRLTYVPRLLEDLEERSLPSITEYPIPTPGSHARGITTGPDGALWFTEPSNDQIGRLTTAGVFTEYVIPSGADPQEIVSGADGALWFTERARNQIGRLTTAGVFTEYLIPSGNGSPEGITAGPDGALWFTENGVNGIGRLTTAGVFTEYTIPTGGSGPEEITNGPDGALWFTEYNANQIGRITTKGAFTEYPIPTGSTNPQGITSGPDGALWFTENSVNNIGRITTAGAITEYPVPGPGTDRLQQIVAGRDGNLWFANQSNDKVGFITTAGVVTQYATPSSGSLPTGITAGPDGGIWFTESGYPGRIATTGPLDLPLTATGTTVSTVEASSFSGTVATFVDADPGGVATDYTATINWGDTTTSAGVITGTGTFSVSSTHTYAEEGSYTVTISIHDVGGASATATTTAAVADAPLTAGLPLAPLSVTEGSAMGPLTVALFSDPAGNGTASEYSATVAWGDGTTSSGTVVYTGSTSYRVEATHTYSEESPAGGPYQIIVIVQHGTAPVLTINGPSVTVTDAQITALTDHNLPASGLEGTAVPPVLGIATFTDPAGAGIETPAADFTATINWGDGSSDTGTIVSLGGGSYRVDAPAHSYRDEGSYTITVTVTHDALPAVTSPGQTILVADQQLAGLASANLPASGLENVAVGPITGLASFTDPAGAEALSDYTATVNWGDGTTSPGTVANIGSNNFRVDAPSHTYAEEGAYTVTVTLNHDALPALTTPAQTIVIADQQLTGLASANLPAAGLENVSIGPITGLASFTDPAGPEALTDYTATVNWGDGTTSHGTVVSTGGGNFRVDAPAHTYVDEGTYTVNVTLKHDGLPALTTTSQTIVIADTQVTAPVAANLPTSGVEGTAVGPITGIATFTDPAGAEPATDYTATINWGDGTTSLGTVVSTGGNNYRIDAPAHSYAEEGPYTVTVSIKHDALAALTSNSQTITVADQQITALTDANLSLLTGLEGASLPAILGIATFSDPAGAGAETPASDFTATINWGDGSSDTGTVVALGGGSYRVNAPAHSYAEEGSYTVTVTVKHDALGAVTSAGQTITIGDNPPSNLGSSNLPATGQENVSLAAITGIANFTDPAGPEAVTDYSATVNWGDGTTSPGTVVSTGGNTFRVDAPAHTYAEEGIYTVNVTLQHDNLAALTTPNQTIVIADQQLTNLGSGNLPASGAEGNAVGPITGIATFTDPAGAEPATNYTTTVNWGDGTTSPGTVVNTGGNNFRVDASAHTYEEGTYAVTVTVRHDALAAVTSNSQTITIADAPLAATGIAFTAAPQAPFNTAVAFFTDPDLLAAAGNYAGVIDWGDGSSSTGVIVLGGGGQFQVTGSHAYTSPGTYAVVTTIRDDGGASAVASAQATVPDAGHQPPAPSVPPPAPLPPSVSPPNNPGSGDAPLIASGQGGTTASAAPSGPSAVVSPTPALTITTTTTVATFGSVSHLSHGEPAETRTVASASAAPEPAVISRTTPSTTEAPAVPSPVTAAPPPVPAVSQAPAPVTAAAPRAPVAPAPRSAAAFRYDSLRHELDALEDDLAGHSRDAKQTTLVLLTSALASAGYVMLQSRVGSWLLSVLAARPLWRQLDPLEVLFLWEREKRRRQAQDEPEDEETLQSLVR
jgi:streptogramin lyase/PKD repeat protein